jgi:hypothetical protein
MPIQPPTDCGYALQSSLTADQEDPQQIECEDFTTLDFLGWCLPELISSDPIPDGIHMHVIWA